MALTKIKIQKIRAFLMAAAGAFGLLPPGAPPVMGEQFLYKHTAGDKYRILSTVKEDVYINRRLSHTSEIINRIAVEVRAVENGRGSLGAVFQTAERAVAASGEEGGFQWGREYDSAFDRDTRGHITIDEQYFMPVVRNVPVFPDRDLKIGDTWSEEGYEMHDFRSGFGIREPYRIPFTAHYEFLGERSWRGVPYPAFSVTYRILSEPEPASGKIYPTRIMGASGQVVYWNPELGQAAAYEEHFRMIFDLSDGATIEYRGSAQAELIETERMDKRALAEDIREDLAETGVEDVSVRESDEGIVLSLDNIQFYPDSNQMLPGEQEKLDTIALILLRYKERDILVGGHTALAGTATGRKELSLQRAASVAEYLINNKVRSPERVMVRGYGAERPVADNRTEEGRSRNRRVEITILEN